MRLLRIDSTLIGDHVRLTEGDECFFFGEYTARKGFAFSEMNNLIINLKKPVDLMGSNQWRWKEKAIADAAKLIGGALNPTASFTLVPMPPSKIKTDPLYDDRMLRILRLAVGSWHSSDVRELVIQKSSTCAAHLTTDRPTVQSMIDNYCVDELNTNTKPQNIFIVDDVLTTGTHFKAAQHILKQRFPTANIYGLFIARRVPESIDFSSIVLEGET